MNQNTKRILIAVAFIIVFLIGILTSWYVYESGLIKVKAGSVEGFLVLSILTLLLVFILVGIGYLIKQISDRVKNIKAYEKEDSGIKTYQDFESLSPLFKTFQIIFIGTVSLIALIVIGLVIITVYA